MSGKGLPQGTCLPSPVHTAHLLRPLAAELVGLLRGLPLEAWDRPTSAGGWRVRDVAAHLLDGDLRRLSFHRDALPLLLPSEPIRSYRDLVDFLDGLNASWVEASRRLSPRILVELLEWSGRSVCDLLEALDPEGPGRERPRVAPPPRRDGSFSRVSTPTPPPASGGMPSPCAGSSCTAFRRNGRERRSGSRETRGLRSLSSGPGP